MRWLITPVLLLSAGVAVGQESPFLAAARKREEATRSVEFVVKEKKTYPRGGSGLEPKPGFAEPEVIPPEDRTSESTTRLIYDGTRVWSERDGTLSMGLRSLGKVFAVQNDRESRGLADQRPDGSGRVAGLITPPHIVAGQADYKAHDPIYFACRLPQSLLISKAGVEPTRTTTVIDGATCVGYRLPGKQVVWADPNQEYAIRRIEIGQPTRDGPRTTRYDIRPEKHPVVGWWPAGWTATDRHPSGRVASTLTATATMTRVGEKFADDLFELTFPAGTVVTDASAGRAKPYVQYIVGPNGEELPVPKEVRVPSVELPKPWHPYQRVGVILGVVGGISLILAVARKVQLRRRNRLPGLAA